MILTPSAKDVLRHAGIEVYWQEGGADMMICQVVGHVWATKKEEGLNGHKLMIVRGSDDKQKEWSHLCGSRFGRGRNRGAGTGGERQHSQAGHRFR